MNRRIRILGIFKAIILSCIIVTLIILISSCNKTPMAVEKQEEKGQETVPSENKETSKETKETAPETTIEIEKVNAPEMEGLRFEQATKNTLLNLIIPMVWKRER